MHKHYFLETLALAESRRGYCAPNPSVGAVVVKDEKIIARGCHWMAGKAHAEVDALEKMDEQARDATLYISLEPCCHWGKTPPCTDAIIHHGIKTVYYACRDPNPDVAGKSERILHEAGIVCEYIPCDDIIEFYKSYYFWWQHKRPFVTAKLAISLDGKIAGPQGEPRKITGNALQRFTHEQRRRADAILTTARTVNNDDPQFNVRVNDQIETKPIYILDRQLKLQNDLQIYKTAKHITILHGQSKCRKDFDHEMSYVILPEMCEKIDLKMALTHIGKEGVHDLWVEAGGICFQTLLTEGLLNQAFIYIAPIVLGHDARPAFVDPQDIFNAARKIQWHPMERDVICEIQF